MLIRILCLLIILISTANAASKNQSSEHTQMLLIPMISASTDSHVNFGGAAYFFRLINKSDISYLYVNASTKGDVFTSINSFDPKFFELFSYQLYLSYGNIGYIRYYGPSGINDGSRVSNISLQTVNSLITYGFNLTDYLNFGAGLVINKTRAYTGRALSNVDKTFATYPSESNYYKNSFSVARRIYLRVDTRNSTTVPTDGELLEFDLDRSDGTLGSDLIFTRYTFEANKVLAIAPSIYFVPRFRWESVVGDNLPFYSLAGIGGSSRLRAFGDFRFMDNHAMLFGSELRYQFLNSENSWYKFFEIAAFVDAGNVANSISAFAMSNLQYCFGGGIRVNISPGIIFRFDYATNTREHYFYIQQGYPF